MAMKDGLPASSFLVVEDPEKTETWHLPVKDADGKPDHRLMGAAYAALTSNHRGATYSGPNKAAALKALKALYKAEKMPLPGDEGTAGMSLLEKTLTGIFSRQQAEPQEPSTVAFSADFADGAPEGSIRYTSVLE